MALPREDGLLGAIRQSDLTLPPHHSAGFEPRTTRSFRWVSHRSPRVVVQKGSFYSEDRPETVQTKMLLLSRKASCTEALRTTTWCWLWVAYRGMVALCKWEVAGWKVASQTLRVSTDRGPLKSGQSVIHRMPKVGT